MTCIVQKYGGSSVADVDRLRKIVRVIADLKSRDNDIAVVVSAMGKTTDELVAGHALEAHIAFGYLQVGSTDSGLEDLYQGLAFGSELSCLCDSIEPESMGLAPGGLMEQDIYEDEYGFDAWDANCSSRCFVHILNSVQWETATGKEAPCVPPNADDYTKAGLPWFDYYNDNLKPLKGSKKLAGLDSVAAKGVKQGEKPLPKNNPANPKKVIKLGPVSKKVSEGNW